MNVGFSIVIWIFLLQIYNITSIPVRGNFPWTVLLCKFYDIDYEPKLSSDIRDWIVQSDKEGGINHFFHQMSDGLYSIDGSNIYGWFSIPYPKATVEFLALNDPKLSQQDQIAQRLFTKTKELCKETAIALGFQISHDVITIINDGSFALFCKENGVLLSPDYMMTSALAHEMVHNFHIGHSFSDRRIRVYPYARLGEYDDKYDLMSTSNAYMYSSSFGMNGPGLNGPHLDYLGWIPSNRMYFFGSEGETMRTFRLASLSLPYNETTGTLLIHIPYDRDNIQHSYIVEYRTVASNDRGAPYNSVIIHRLQDQQGYLFSILTTKSSTEYGWRNGTEFAVYYDKINNPGSIIRIRIVSTEDTVASVIIESGFSPTKCHSNEVRRRTYPTDQVCITKDEEYILRAESASKNETNECPEGLVPREAGPDDRRCITKFGKNLIIVQNQRHQRYKMFYETKTFGLNACANDYVWRLIDSHDFTCISALRKIENDRQNSLHKFLQRGNSCRTGYVLRRAIPTDDTCVTPVERLSARFDTQNGQYQLLYRKFFNGIDTID